MLLSDVNRDWLERFISSHGRAPKVLHIGNIANNAYNNAKLLNGAGFRCDVLCYDYYHTMGSPEWEDADFSGRIEDDFHPAWYQVGVHGFDRPRWFVQGPLALCIEYLLATVYDPSAAKRLWETLAAWNMTRRPNAWFFMSWRVRRFARRIAQVARMPFSKAFPLIVDRLNARAGYPVGSIIGRLLRPLWWLVQLVVPSSKEMAVDGAAFDERLQSLQLAWSAEFPARADRLLENDLEPYRETFPAWRLLLAQYDLVVGYSTDGIFPLLSAVPYFAFEHGTIREIPYAITAQGRAAALTYRMAKHVFVTNFDCRASAQTLAPGRFTLINHPYDEERGDQISGWADKRSELLERLRSQLLCFFPTRHDWVPGTGYADKANDVFLRAIADLRAMDIRVGVVCCEWGANVAQSRALIDEMGIADQVYWDKPMAMMKFERTARACDIVVDQFKLGSFGGILFKAMAVGAPVLTFLDEARLLEQYAEIPPVINCERRDQIVSSLARLASNPGELERLSAASKRWIDTYHGKRDTINRQVDQFRHELACH